MQHDYALKKKIWPFDPTLRIGGIVCDQNICYHATMQLHAKFSLIWHAIWPYFDKVEFWAGGGGGGGWQNIAIMFL